MKKRHEIGEIAGLWVEKAENDYLTASHTLKLKKQCPFDTICFHAQQCAEKYIKAILVLNSTDFPKTHDLTELFKLLPEGYKMDLNPSELSFLNSYSVSVRYPGFEEPFTRKDARLALAMAEKIRRNCRKVLKDFRVL